MGSEADRARELRAVPLRVRDASAQRRAARDVSLGGRDEMPERRGPGERLGTRETATPELSLHEKAAGDAVSGWACFQDDFAAVGEPESDHVGDLGRGEDR